MLFLKLAFFNKLFHSAIILQVLVLPSPHSATCARSYPRHACPLKRSLLMQVHERPQAAPVLVLRGIKNTGICMQNHAPYECMAFFGKNSGIFGDFFACYRVASSARRRV